MRSTASDALCVYMCVWRRKERDVAAVRLLAQSMADFAKSSRVQEAGADGLIAFAREGTPQPLLIE